MPVITVKHQETHATDSISETSASVPTGRESSNSEGTFSRKWTNAVRKIHSPILSVIHKLTNVSAKHPKAVIASVVGVSILTFVLGILFGFSLDVDEDRLWTPAGSKPLAHQDWIDDESGFPIRPRAFTMVFHQDGDDAILGQEQVQRIFQAVDAVRGLEDYPIVCARTPGTGECSLDGVTKFWNNTVSIFDSQVASDSDAVQDMSALTFPDDATPVQTTDIFGNAVRDEATGLLTGAQSYILTISLPEDDDDKDENLSLDFEKKALDVILDLDEQWEAETGNAFRVEVIADRSFPDEFERSILADLPLVPIVFILMGAFTALVFFKKDKVRSRALLGFMAVVSVLLSIIMGYGLMFLCTVPFTSMTQILPFVFFGVGLDDTFIMTGSFFRTDPSKTIEERVYDMTEDIGMSIFLTTFTSSLAFALGCISSIPAVSWLCVYAVPTIVFIFLWQLTFFLACMTLDERRVAANNRDCLRCCSRQNNEAINENSNERKVSRIDSWMESYTEQLLRPWVKVVVVVVFAAIAAVCAVSTSNLKQSFTFTDVLPDDSYITDFFDAFNEYSARSSILPSAYFRFVDQADPEIQDQMEKYVNDLVAIDAIVDQPPFFWLRDFRAFVAEENISNLEFDDQMIAFLNNPVYNELYRDHIVLNDSGGIEASRVVIPMDNVNLEDVGEQIDALEDQDRVTEEQPINKGQNEFRFFTYEGTYNIWEFYAVSADEIVFTTISGVCAVTGVALLLVPHWTAAFLVFPLICVLYIDLLGFMQFCGVSINPVSYISLVMSIGLLVDFILHVLLRYYEAAAPGATRHEKVMDMMRTMGSSVLIGAVTTLLGTVPLAFSTSSIFSTVFIAFLGLVLLGGAHGLILLPVILSMIGPEDHVGVVAESTAPAADSTKALGDPAEDDDDDRFARRVSL